MGSKTQYFCDHCKVETLLTNSGRSPKGWRRIRVMRGSDQTTHNYLVCEKNDCLNQLLFQPMHEHSHVEIYGLGKVAEHVSDGC